MILSVEQSVSYTEMLLKRPPETLWYLWYLWHLGQWHFVFCITIVNPLWLEQFLVHVQNTNTDKLWPPPRSPPLPPHASAFSVVDQLHIFPNSTGQHSSSSRIPSRNATQPFLSLSAYLSLSYRLLKDPGQAGKCWLLVSRGPAEIVLPPSHERSAASHPSAQEHSGRSAGKYGTSCCSGKDRMQKCTK